MPKLGTNLYNVLKYCTQVFKYLDAVMVNITTYILIVTNLVHQWRVRARVTFEREG